MKRKDLLTLGLLLFGILPLSVWSQEGIHGSGGEATGGGGKVSYSVGQAFFISATGGTGSVGMGVQQAAEISQLLPIELLLFDAVLTDDRTVKLSWETSWELNNAYFTVERSREGRNWNGILEKEGSGHSTERRTYVGYDDDPYAGVSYYRLKQTDYDGEYSYSEIVPVKVSLVDISLSPNPINDMMNIRISSGGIGEWTYEILNELGMAVERGELSSEQSSVQTGSLASGRYYVVFYVDNELMESIQIIKQ
jgi:hypothetical protein